MWDCRAQTALDLNSRCFRAPIASNRDPVEVSVALAKQLKHTKHRCPLAACHFRIAFQFIAFCVFSMWHNGNYYHHSREVCHTMTHIYKFKAFQSNAHTKRNMRKIKIRAERIAVLFLANVVHYRNHWNVKRRTTRSHTQTPLSQLLYKL